jgi:uncharacterized protein (TIGR00255 family)
MIYSMTAFARAEQPFDGGSVQWELRTVNQRYLEVQFRLPESLRDLEPALRDTLRKRLRRGKVDAALKYDLPQTGGQLTLNRPLLLQLLAAIEQIKRDAPEASHPDPLDLLRWPGMLSEQRSDLEAARDVVTGSFDAAIDALLAHRAREGAELAQLIDGKFAELLSIVEEVRSLTAGLAAEQLAKLKARVDELGVSLDSARLEQEVALLAQRADVAEELDRILVHVQEGRHLLSKPGPHGRQLDFLMQELNREANTLGSKSVLAQTAQRAIDLKVIIEQIREQVQNIE